MSTATLDDVFSDDITIPAMDGYPLAASPRYLFDDTTLAGLQNFPNFKGTLRALTFTDDPWATLPAVELLCNHLTGTTADIIPVNPAELGAKGIGHFGFFRPEHRDALWRGAAEWLAGE